MTCREFKHNAASLTLWELSRAQDGEILAHAEGCEACGAWLQRQRKLAASMQTLQVRTAGLEAGPDVERALLRAFRQVIPADAAKATAGAEERTVLSRPWAAPSSAPFAFGLSRFFEVGAYVAVAAAIVVGMLLGVRLLQHRSTMTAGQAQVQTVPQRSVPVVQQPAAAAHPDDAVAKLPLAAASHRPASSAWRSMPGPQPTSAGDRIAKAPQIAALESQAETDASYMALMFCDPLSCSGDSQVVRMELPGSGANQNSQPQMADVVVGYDGVVRAVRIVN